MRRCFEKLLFVFATLLLAFAPRSQVSSYGVDQNPGGQFFALGDPVPPPKLGTHVTVMWYFDIPEHGDEVLVFGPDVPVCANICWYTNHPAHMLDKWLLVPPIVIIPMWKASHGVPPYNITIPSDPRFIGQAVRVQVFRLVTPGSGSMCDRLQATNALRIQFMY